MARSSKPGSRRRAPREAQGPLADGQGIDLATLPDHIGYVISRAQVAIFQKIIDRMAALGIRPGQFSVLTVIGANPGLKLGICGEHGGDPDSIRFFRNVGLDYVSCSPYRVPIARLAAAQAALGKEIASQA